MKEKLNMETSATSMQKGNGSDFTEDEYRNLSTEELLSRSVCRSKEPEALTSKELIRRNEQRICDCACLGVSKAAAAELVSKDPRNCAGIKAPTIMRDMNDVLGKWSELVRRSRNSSITIPQKHPNVEERSRELYSAKNHSAANPFLDQSFNDGDVL